eukprot:7858056-Alexandrium_andersonii.AAC.1
MCQRLSCSAASVAGRPNSVTGNPVFMVRSSPDLPVTISLIGHKPGPRSPRWPVRPQCAEGPLSAVVGIPGGASGSADKGKQPPTVVSGRIDLSSLPFLSGPREGGGSPPG